MNNPDYPHLIREAYYLNEQAQEKLNENNYTMKTHLEERLKLLRDNLLLMQDLRNDPLTDESLKLELGRRIAMRLNEIENVKKSIRLIPVNNIFHEAIQFDIEGRYPNSANVWNHASTFTTSFPQSQQ